MTCCDRNTDVYDDYSFDARDDDCVYARDARYGNSNNIHDDVRAFCNACDRDAFGLNRSALSACLGAGQSNVFPGDPNSIF